ncbi:proline--tRNA ligase, partial [Acidobacteria bacterium AH-259-G07]|nr:proline--tRNA ligase [Acidobacteria bacterium AH-259-G07]
MVAYLTQSGQTDKSSLPMRWSKLFIPTLREIPAEAEAPSHQLLVRSGFIRQLSAGIYSYLPMARRTLLKIEHIIREEMDRIGAQEFYLPALQPAELWKETGRWTAMGENMFRLKDRTNREMCLGMTHEEVFTAIARHEIRSYRDLPQIWYQIQVKFRDELRPKSGLLRIRQFMMKDSYSFDLNPEGLDISYRLHDQAYRAIFDRCGLRYVVVEAESGAMGGSESQEFMVESEAGEDAVVTCKCGYAANLQRATSPVSEEKDEEGEFSPVEIHTPGQKTIQEVSDFLKIPKSQQMKSLVYIVESKPHLILLRGDHQLNEARLAHALGTDIFRPATAEEIRHVFGADPGSLGPVGLESIPILADMALKGRRNMVCGANKDDYHLKNVTPEKDFNPSYHDLRQVEPGDACARCGNPLRVTKTLEVGHIFKLGYKYSKSMGATVLTQKGKEVPIIMGSYGIGLERIMVAAAELYHDDDGMVWPRSIAPFQVVITLLRPDHHQQREAAEMYYQELTHQGMDCLLD